MILLALALAARADANGADALKTALAELDQHLTYAFPPLSSSQLNKLDKGKLVRFRVAPTDGHPLDEAVALEVVDLPRTAVWISTIDAHFVVKSGLTERRIRFTPDHGQLWMGLLDLPFPIDDRAWVVETHDNPTLVEATKGRAWERWWGLRKDCWSEVLALASAGKLDGPTRASLDKAILTPVNEGAWVFDELPDGRLLVGYHAATVVGGAIPTDILTRLVVSGLDELFTGTFDRARSVVPTHYVAGHEPIEGGDGRVLPYY